MVEIPYQSLESDTLRALIEDFVTRDGTDYGERECGLETKITQVMNQLKSAKIAIVFDSYTQTCGLITKNGPIGTGTGDSV